MSDAVSADATLPSTHSAPSRKTTKRKIDDALFNLDQALRSTEDIKRPPAKKTRFPGSLYTTLAKYGIKSSRSSFASESKFGELNIIKKTAPHLSAILSRAASKKEKATHREELARASVTNLSTTTLQPTALEYRPSSTTSFLSRLSTFKLSTYATKPTSIDAVAAAKAGWVNEGKERLLCGICKASWFLASRDGMSRDAANTLIEKQRVSLVQMHRDGCPWRAQQCDASIYGIPLQSPSVLAKEVKTYALELDDQKVLEGVEIRHPLTSGQVQALLSALSSVKPSPRTAGISEVDESTHEVQTAQEETAQVEPSQKAALTAVLGWSLVPPNTESRPSTPSVTRASSISHVPAITTATRRPTWNASSISEAGSPRPSRIPAPRTSSVVSTRSQRQETAKKRHETLLHCTLCQRRVGLWAFKSNEAIPPTSTSPVTPVPSTPIAPESSTDVTSELPSASTSTGPSRLPVRRLSQTPMPKRQFDLLKEHRSYCPYVVRSTTVPSLSALANSASPARSVSAGHAAQSPRPTPSRSNSVSSFNFSFSPRNAPQYPEPGTTGALCDPAAVEGWRAVLTMVMRSGLGRRQRQRAMMNVNGAHSSSTAEGSGDVSGGAAITPADTATEREPGGDAMEIDGIHAMVEDVKLHGGKDLLRYVKSLFA